MQRQRISPAQLALDFFASDALAPPPPAPTQAVPEPTVVVTSVSWAPAFVAPSPELVVFLEAGELRGWSRKTLRAYRLELTRVERELGGPMVSFDKADLTRYLAWLSRRGVKGSTVNKSIAVMRSFTGWAADEGLVATDHAARLRQVKEETLLPIHFGEGEVERLFAEARNARDLAMLHVAYYLGARAGEVVGLTLDAIDWEAGTVRLFGKGSKERTGMLHDALRASLEAHLAERGRAPGRLFPLTYDGFRHFFNKARNRAGLPKKYTLHKLRHTFATRLLAHGEKLDVIQKLMGHSSVTTTQRYAHTVMPVDLAERIGAAL